MSIPKRCVCKLLSAKDIQAIIDNKPRDLIRISQTLPSELTASALLLNFLLRKSGSVSEEEEYKAMQQANLYGESLGNLMGRRKKIRVEEISGLVSKSEESLNLGEPSTVVEYTGGDIRVPPNAIISAPIKEDKIEEKLPEITKVSAVEFHYNSRCLSCQKLDEKMIKIGPLIFCSDCFKLYFKTNNPLVEEKSVVRAWLSYTQDILLGQNPIKPNR